MGLLGLRIFATIIVAISAIIALWGNPRENNKFTKSGKLSILLIALGLIIAVVTEYYHWKEEKRNEKITILTEEFNNDWILRENSPLLFIGFEFFDRHEYVCKKQLHVR